MVSTPELLSATSNLFCLEDAGDVASWDASAAPEDEEWAPRCRTTAAALADGAGLASLLAAEAGQPSPGGAHFAACSLFAAARSDAIKWIRKVNEFYRFRAVTAYLSVTYLDRFLSSHSLPAVEKGGGGGGGGAGWPMQLISVACLSVAAKMEEVRVPSLLDLQILDPGYVFDPCTVRRMELLLMAATGWRMRAITPFDFFPHLSAASPLLSRAADLVLSTLSVVDFISFRPSEIAVAAVLCAADESTDGPAANGGNLLSRSDDWANKEMVSRCRQLMEGYVTDTCRSASRSKPNPPPRPATEDSPTGLSSVSPVAILDAAAGGGCSSSCDSAALHPEPPPKRRRLGDTCTELEHLLP
ncbi:cyclin-D2-1-like [Zingiber officinale]|uniref:cyclin-D2-1-like n=1 Tax=Zingiber officinale TaxID=94328 RepID=UPI001C4AEB43|nr:cyclin-D2-1-like [Zingiber officinale]